MYKAKPTWAKEDAMGAYRKGGSTRTLRKAENGETVTSETPSAPTPAKDAPKDKDYVKMSNKEFRAEKQGVKREKKLKDIESGANKEKADKIINTIGNIATTAANVTDIISNAKNKMNNNNSGGNGGPDFKKGGATKMKKYAMGGSTLRPATDKANRGMFKTGGMVNANSKITAAKKATGKSGGTTKAISKTAVKSASPKGKVGGTSKAPKKASPVKLAKAKMGGMKGKSC